ncbi:PHP domain-containing protein [Candidatus Bipolaricaulota bacterium]|nr:PHP domain-containing protein [Candidatus Bipolaricaulota bacterium]
MRRFVADLHIHTCLSPCASLRMSPKAIVDTALARGLDLIAITDHNSCAMADVVGRIAKKRDLGFLFGIEFQTAEEVHVLGYFDHADSCRAAASEAYRFLPDRRNDPLAFGDQVIVDEEETILAFEPKLLLNSLSLTIEQVFSLIRRNGGLAVPAHIDREAFGIIAQLGFIHDNLRPALVEVTGKTVPSSIGGAGILRSSDAHDLEEIGRNTTTIVMDSVSVRELEWAAATKHARKILG